MTKFILNMIDAWNCKLGKDQSFQKRTGQHCQQWKWMDISPDSKFPGTPSSGFLFTKMSINTLLRMWTAFNLHISNTQRQSITLWQRILDHFAWVRETGDWTFAVHSWKLKAKDVRKYAPDPCARHSQQDLTAAGNLEEKTIDKLNKERKKDCAWSTKGCSRIQSRRKVPGKGALCGLHGCSRESNVSFLAGLHCEAAPVVAGPFWQPGLLFCLLMARTFEVVLWFFVLLYFFRYIILFFLWNLDNFIFLILLLAPC